MAGNSVGDNNKSKFLHDEVYESIPPNYDLINHLFTGGMDICWRKKAARETVASHPVSVLDICCGTGDLSLSVAKLAEKDTKVTGLDFSRPMLDIAIKKAQKAGCDIAFVTGDIADIPFPDNSFDSICIGFGFRNLTYKNEKSAQYISEILRVLKPGGRFVIVESSQPAPNAKFIRFFQQIYVKYIVSFLGRIISGNSAAYQYLAKSAANYYGAEQLRDLLLKSGFSRVTFKRLFFGAAAIHMAVK
ncbi:MAG: ubiquinone/menaquinone biosynthesis methyltransferase [Dehalococcoidales bacterium]|nr:ubiquinone/menaquinone biosynthesis methyltransferase [Dehalococcoidales bacterium]